MAQSLNQITLLGRLGGDPEKRTVGKATVANASLATSQSWKDAQGEWQEKTQWHRIVAWSNERGPQLADALMKAQKGDRVLVAGMMEYRKYTDKEGVERWIAEVKAQVVVPLGDGRGGAEKPSGPRKFDDFPEPLDGEDDDLPF